MPRVAQGVGEQLRQWVLGLNGDVVGAILHRYGIDPHPTLERLARMKAAVSAGPADIAINRLWVTT